ncbi:uncharacterized protein TEOVI_000830000 [Trypanosoma equiperdum]|uniref:Uncharacterized protein n=2 Tax=Trypanozoon TaxID=39700 RepID=Q38C28_TRYB2|nr:hypothetical protein, conserved [Trypanosoma brucei brucei TREU927]EAN77642.1 hypothetical protein, conserved [Trypanosoma brucei brucei TREU927]SCU67602.1 hypothetical protein, conserved [Trypanosoma equiperdum]
MDAEEYLHMKEREMMEEYGAVILSQRNEIEQLQRRCSELLHERSFMRASVAEDVRQFCVGHLQRQQAQQQRASGRLATSSACVQSIPVLHLLQFLHQYTSGVVPVMETEKRKRPRETGTGGICPNTPHQQRLVQRMITRRRLCIREGDSEESLQGIEVQSAEQPICADQVH